MTGNLDMVPKRRSRSLRVITALAALVSAAGCGRERSSSGAPGAGARDSAGIAIVENARGAWPDGGGWVLAANPSADIGGGMRGVEYELSGVAGAVRLSDGRLALANGASSEIRFYDSTGTFLSRAGRQGSGPGEYQVLAGLWRGRGDSLLVSDMGAQRLAVLDGSGALVRHVGLGGRSGLAMGQGGRVSLAVPQGWFSDGSILGAQMPFTVNDRREGAYRDTVALLRFDGDGTVADTIGRFPGIEMRALQLTMGGRSFAAPNPVPLGRQTVSAAAGERVYVATNDAWQVEQRRQDGTLLRLIRLAVEPRVLSEAEIERHREESAELFEGLPQLRAVPEQLRKQITERVRAAEYPRTLPFVGGMYPIPDGTLAVLEVAAPGQPDQQLVIFDSAGAFLGRVRLPARLLPTMVSERELVGVWRDADGVEHVRVYPIRR